ncbi:hypothetical protein BDV36DRAFT_284455 [Aspergillus pseudocaelatus]|uniref:Uncharacterized protein n=1 Tax=Aspergillus pseudocaelatus TaxID=1825620 RepID=A0ABQ6WHJ6_9EURO|nr:hypothetical protein BDV36DRAFT_284455 [Aspergillus pseudocaelatus]
MTDCAAPKEAINIFSLVRDPSQDPLDEFHSNPPISDFTTGFEGAPDAELRHFATECVTDLAHTQVTSLTISWIAVLDERSLSEITVVMHHYRSKSVWEQTMRESDVDEAEDSIWWKWRVPFSSSFNLWNNIMSLGKDALELYSREEYLGEDGIVDGEVEDPKGVFT